MRGVIRKKIMKDRIMFFLDVMYYYVHSFYEKLLKKVSPPNQPSIILSSFIAFPIALFIDFIYILLFCSPPPPWIFLSVCFGFIFLMLKIYEWNNRKVAVIKKKPMFFNSKKVTLFIMVAIQLISFATLLLGGPVGKYLLGQCGWVG